MLYQMLEHVTVFSSSCYHSFCLHNLPSSATFLSVFLWEVRGGSFASDGICMDSNVTLGFKLYHSPNIKTLHKVNSQKYILLMLNSSRRRLRLDLGRLDEGCEICWMFCHQSRHQPSTTTTTPHFSQFLLYLVFWKHLDMITVLHLYDGQKSIVN